MANMVKTAITDAVKTSLAALSTDPIERTGELSQTRWDIERALELVKHNQKLAAIDTREQREYSKFVAMREKYQAGFGIGMSIPKNGTKQ